MGAKPGRRKGQRSIRLNRAWRAIYAVLEPQDGEAVPTIEVTEVSKHDC